jgi:rhomboid protease GluP
LAGFKYKIIVITKIKQIMVQTKKQKYMQTKNILITANIAVYTALSFCPKWYEYLYNSGYETLVLHQYWRLFSYGFVHGGLWHLFFNLYFLNIVAKLDCRNLLRNYLVCLPVAGLISIFSHIDTPSIGASGAVLGCLFYIIADVLIGDKSKRTNPSVLLTVLIVVIFSVLPFPHTDVAAHIGGMVCGVILRLFLFFLQK